MRLEDLQGYVSPGVSILLPIGPASTKWLIAVHLHSEKIPRNFPERPGLELRGKSQAAIVSKLGQPWVYQSLRPSVLPHAGPGPYNFSNTDGRRKKNKNKLQKNKQHIQNTPQAVSLGPRPQVHIILHETKTVEIYVGEPQSTKKKNYNCRGR